MKLLSCLFGVVYSELLRKFSADKKKGYNINELVNTIVTELQLIQEINMCIIGAGKLGHAIINYFKDSDTRFNIKAVFDKDLKQKKELGNCCNMASIDNLEAVIKEKKITFVILTVPANEITSIISRLEKTDIKGILNFTSVPIKVDKKIKVITVDITLEMEKLAFFSH